MKKLVVVLLLVLVFVFCACTSTQLHIGDNGNWWDGDTDLGIPVQGPEGATPYIGNNGNWWIEGKDLGVSAQGPQGDQGQQGIQGVPGQTGAQGPQGQQGIQGPQGKPGQNGVNGNTPYIGENGNWWIGSTDTGVLADYSADNRQISDGLEFVITTVNGKAGMVVVDYDGNAVDVVIPNFVGAVPVIGIGEDAFAGNTSIKSVSFSKNTTWLDEGVFSGCSNLETIDFNGAMLTEISTKAFYGCAIKNIALPETVTKLNNYAFYNCPLESINFENITYFGDYSLTGIQSPSMIFDKDIEYIGSHVFDSDFIWVYIEKGVDYIANNAFECTYLYLEDETIPTTWDSEFCDIGYKGKSVTSCSIANDYIYSANGSGATINRYIGESKKISVPSEIAGVEVTEIGVGFDSYNESWVDDDLVGSSTDYDTAYLNLLLEEVVIPDSVTKIDALAFYYSHSFVYVPYSVNITEENDWGEGYQFYAFFAFEDEEKLFGEDDYVRAAYGIDYSKLVRDEENKLYLYKDLLGYSILASVPRINEEIVIPSQYKGTNIHTIKEFAMLCEYCTVIISDGVNKIQRYGILGAESVYIPKSVTIINAYGVEANYYFVEVETKPSEWDTYWNDGDSNAMFGADDEFRYDSDKRIVYKIEDGKVTLLKYVGSSSTLYIPRQIKGYTVAKIATEFYSYNYSAKIYIPKEIEVICENAFINRGSNTFSFYFETEGVSANWDDNWYYNTYYSSATRYISIYWNQTFSY